MSVTDLPNNIIQNGTVERVVSARGRRNLDAALADKRLTAAKVSNLANGEPNREVAERR